MTHLETMMDYINELESTLETITRLAEIAPALDGSDAAYFTHALVLLHVIGEYARDAELTANNLVAQLRTGGGAS